MATDESLVALFLARLMNSPLKASAAVAVALMPTA